MGERNTAYPGEMVKLAGDIWGQGESKKGNVSYLCSIGYTPFHLVEYPGVSSMG